MQADYLGRFSFIEVAIHRIAHLLTKGIQSVRLGKDRLPRARAVKPPSPASSIKKMISFMHARKAPLDCRDFRDSAVIGKNPLGSSMALPFFLPTSYFLLPTSYFLLPTSYFLSTVTRRNVAGIDVPF